MQNIAFFITPHGFGHAARASAVMSALARLKPEIHFHIFTQTAQWFFENSVSAPFSYHHCLTDVGFAQRGPLVEDLPQTVRNLSELIPFHEKVLNSLASTVQNSSCSLILCDIAALGIAVGKRAGIKSVLIENFLWDHIYQGYLTEAPTLCDSMSYLKEWYEQADYHVQAFPACVPAPSSYPVAPIARSPRLSRTETRQQLEIDETCKLVLLTMGGIPGAMDYVTALKSRPDVRFIVAGAPPELQQLTLPQNITLLLAKSPFYHPDLVAASDLVVSKLGYSTFAESYYSGVPYGFLSRKRFAESDVLKELLLAEGRGAEIQEQALYSGSWLSTLDNLLSIGKISGSRRNGADEAASFICDATPELALPPLI